MEIKTLNYYTIITKLKFKSLFISYVYKFFYLFLDKSKLKPLLKILANLNIKWQYINNLKEVSLDFIEGPFLILYSDSLLNLMSFIIKEGSLLCIIFNNNFLNNSFNMNLKSFDKYYRQPNYLLLINNLVYPILLFCQYVLNVQIKLIYQINLLIKQNNNAD